MEDATVIQEIATQLGMAADQAGQFVAEQLPQYAAMRVMRATVGMVPILAICAVVFLLAALFIVYVVRLNRRKGDDYDGTFAYDFLGRFAICVSALVMFFAVAGFFYELSADLPAIVGWSQYPEAMLVDMALEAIG